MLLLMMMMVVVVVTVTLIHMASGKQKRQKSWIFFDSSNVNIIKGLKYIKSEENLILLYFYFAFFSWEYFLSNYTKFYETRSSTQCDQACNIFCSTRTNTPIKTSFLELISSISNKNKTSQSVCIYHILSNNIYMYLHWYFREEQWCGCHL